MIAERHCENCAPGAIAGFVLVLLALAGAPSAGAASEDAGAAPERLRAGEIEPFARKMRERYGLAEDAVARILADATVEQRVIDAMNRPAEAKPWHEYRDIFLTEPRIAEGARFWQRNADTVARAHERFGVAPEVIVAIIGVETFYGRNIGRSRVLDSLATLAFRYPRRASFFLAELEQFLLLAAKEGIDPRTTTGSYAGAMGIPQFIASSYRRYAVDFDGDGARDLIGSPADAIGSVANYLAEHGWRRDAPVALRASVAGADFAELLERGLEPHTPLGKFAAFGVRVDGAGVAEDSATLVELDAADGPEYWAGLRNFYAITRYNHSRMYAMAVFQLAEAIKQRMEGRGG